MQMQLATLAHVTAMGWKTYWKGQALCDEVDAEGEKIDTAHYEQYHTLPDMTPAARRRRNEGERLKKLGDEMMIQADVDAKALGIHVEEMFHLAQQLLN